jgi:hypothetical protein
MEIKFYCNDPAISEHFPPQPANKVIPEWYKELPIDILDRWGKLDVPSAKHCLPLQDMVTSGYILFNSFDVELFPNMVDGLEDFKARTPFRDHISSHPHKQCPVSIDNKKKHYFKIVNEWQVRTPPGYSCLFIQPFYHFQQGYRLLPGIVDTDKFDLPVQFPGYLTSDDTSVTIKSGTPLIQVIPFKREDWTMSVINSPPKRSLLEFSFTETYRSLFHSKKHYK